MLVKQYCEEATSRLIDCYLYEFVALYDNARTCLDIMISAVIIHILNYSHDAQHSQFSHQ